MAGLQARLAHDGRFHFVRRAITRPALAGGEDHVEMTRDAFMELRAAGVFSLSWEAHGLLYGIPRAIARHLEAGRVVVANLSRGVLLEAAAQYPLLVLEVTAPPALLAARLAGRGRESAADIAARLARESPLPPGLAVLPVVNDGTVEEGVTRMLRALTGVTIGIAPQMRPNTTTAPFDQIGS
jgi:phosphonate metabolism protein PhnN/1,5-bisphosphokinase (PRPP-forming)